MMVNTFLPYASFTRSARVLDRARLGKQRVECLQLLNALTGVREGWRNHPAAVMWRGYEPALCAYGIAMCDEWISRGYNDSCRDKLIAFFPTHERFKPTLLDFACDDELPWWFGWRLFHESHRSNLLRKDDDHYSQHFTFTDTPRWDLPYVWPHQQPYRFHRKHSVRKPL